MNDGMDNPVEAQKNKLTFCYTGLDAVYADANLRDTAGALGLVMTQRTMGVVVLCI